MSELTDAGIRRVRRPELPPAPKRCADLPVDSRGYPVPWFVTWIDGQPDFRVITPEKQYRAHKLGICWICGGLLGTSRRAFVIGPMCAVNRISGEPGNHIDCADWAARACPFMSRPHMRRREGGLPEEAAFADSGLLRNPGAALVWITRSYHLEVDRRAAEPTLLFRVGDPESVRWYAEGRDATRAEVVASIESGLPLLWDVALEDGPAACVELLHMYEAALPLLPVS